MSPAPVSFTVKALKSGAAFAVALLVGALALRLLGSDLADRVALVGVVALIATPPLSLAATVLESWRPERSTALLALVVLAVLAVASGVALFVGR